MMLIGRKSKALGVAEGRRYDLPLSKSAGNGFLVVLIALMTFLGALALSAGFALSEMTLRWSSGLENQMTIEISSKGKTQNEIDALKDKVTEKLRDYPGVTGFQSMDESGVQDLIAPWLGADFEIDALPLPGLITLEVTENTAEFIEKLGEDLQAIDANIRLETHEEWLDALLSLIGSMRFLALVITMVVAATGVSAIIAAIRSRMAEHRPDVELLHLMGASDLYIARQFQRHALILGLYGGLCGLGLIIFILLIFSLWSAGGGLLPDFALSTLQILILLSLPVLACVLSGGAARFTVLRALSKMP